MTWLSSSRARSTTHVRPLNLDVSPRAVSSQNANYTHTHNTLTPNKMNNDKMNNNKMNTANRLGDAHSWASHLLPRLDKGLQCSGLNRELIWRNRLKT